MKELGTVDGGHPRRSKRLRVEVPESDHHRCLVSCQVACPVHTDARGYVRAIAEGRFDEAYLIARGPNPFASICGRVCGAPCERACRRGLIPRVDEDGRFLAPDLPVAIRALKRFVCERAPVKPRPPQEVLESVRSYVPEVCADAEEMAALIRSFTPVCSKPFSGEQIAIVGSGPAGLAAAHDLALMGFHPIVFEAESVPAGMLYLGVPEYRLPRELIRHEVAVIEALGVEIHYGKTVGQEVSLSKLRQDFAAVVIAVGAKQSRLLGLPGERGPRVYGGVDLLRSVAVGERLDLGEEVVVVGGGNVAYDVARTVLRQEAYDTARTAARLPSTRNVWLVSLETLEEMPADTVEIREGQEEGIERLNGWGPVEITRDQEGQIKGILLRRCTRVYDEQRRFAPSFADDERRHIPCDTVLLAAGQSPDLSFLEDGGKDIEQVRPAWPKVDPDTLATTAPGVFLAGDLAHGTRLLIDAVASGKRAARSVYRYVSGEALEPEMLEAHIPLERYRRETGYEGIPRVEVPTLSATQRLQSPEHSVESGYTEAQARREASRCLDCGVTPVFDAARCILCGGCVEACPTLCLKIVPLSRLEPSDELSKVMQDTLGPDTDVESNCAILKDEDRCIRCALCEMRCPVQAISMERVRFTTHWRTSS